MMLLIMFVIFIVVIPDCYSLKFPNIVAPTSFRKKSAPNSEQLQKILKEKLYYDNRMELVRMTKEYEKLRLLEINLYDKYSLEEVSNENSRDRIWNFLFSKIAEERRTWDVLPAIMAETYFYYQISKVFDYDNTGFDPFIKSKFASLKKSIPFVEALTARIPELLFQPTELSLEFILQSALWGDKLNVDKMLKMKTEQEVAQKASLADVLIEKKSSILDDDTLQMIYFLKKLSLQSSTANNDDTTSQNVSNLRDISIIVGESGQQLISDLFLGHLLLRLNVCDKVTYHCKSYPTYPDECTTRDIIGTIQYLCDPTVSDVWSVRHFGESLRTSLQEKQIDIIQDPYWSHPTPYWDMPSDIETRLSESSLVIMKGDFNYRRLLGDFEWPINTDKSKLFKYWGEIPLFVIREIKTPLVCNINVLMEQKATREDPNWLSSGKWGVMQFYKGNEE